MGKVKIPIKKIENPNARQVCFSKRRMGIFKKASELAILCGAEIAIIVYSPAGKAFTFGSPDIDFVVDKYQNIPVNIDNEKVHRARKSEQRYNSILRELDAERKRTDKLKRQEKNKGMEVWLSKHIENLELPELIEFRNTLKVFQERIIQVAQEKESINSSANMEPNEMEAAQMPQQSCYFHHDDIESIQQTSPSFASTSGVQYQSASLAEERALNRIDSWDTQELYQFVMGNSLNGSTDARDSNMIQFDPALQKCNGGIQDVNTAVKSPFFTYQNPFFHDNYIPSHLLLPDEGCLPISTELSDLQRVVMPDKKYLLPDADVGDNDRPNQHLVIRENEFSDLDRRIGNEFVMDYGKSTEQHLPSSNDRAA